MTDHRDRMTFLKDQKIEPPGLEFDERLKVPTSTADVVVLGLVLVVMLLVFSAWVWWLR